MTRHRLFRRDVSLRVYPEDVLDQWLRYFRVKTCFGSQSKRVRDVSIERGLFVRSIDILATVANSGRPKGRGGYYGPVHDEQSDLGEEIGISGMMIVYNG